MHVVSSFRQRYRYCELPRVSNMIESPLELAVDIASGLFEPWKLGSI